MSTFTTATASGRGQFQTSSSSPSSLVSFVIVLCTLVIMMTTTIPAIAAAVANTPLTRSLQTQSENTSARRALYLQVYSTYSGNFAFSANASWAQFTYVMQTDWSQDVLVYYLTKYGFNTISLYNVHNALGAPAPTAQFRTLLRTLRARVAGLRIEGIADDYIPAWTRMAAYQNASTDPNEMFDGFVTEIEFWGGANDPSELIASLTHMQQVDRPKQRIPGTPLYYAVYLGNLNQAATTALVESGVVDLMMFHCYVKSPTTCGSYTAARLGYMQIAESNYVATHGVPSRTNGAFAVILSGEGSLYRAGGGSFSGDWMFAQHLANKSANTVAVTEEAATASIGDYKSTAPLLRMQGYQAYEYCFYAVYTGDTMPQADWVALLAQTTTTTTAAPGPTTTTSAPTTTTTTAGPTTSTTTTTPSPTTSTASTTAGPTTTAAPPATGTSARRALYLQVYSTYSGNFAFSANASWAQFTYVMQTDWSQDVLVYYLTKYGFNTISLYLSLIHISEPTRLLSISYAVFCLKKKKKKLRILLYEIRLGQ
eukprot:TRINITY_DN2947_c0_g2_i5.p1 TRINITY_DN2947_c0_g2~~TRINITY_DN2947_c0_g2_i5.p1  ORF type:complete len:540 (+),score=137.23 TRINITY_DN2947_c0_g2_i5:359-1978(+)